MVVLSIFSGFFVMSPIQAFFSFQFAELMTRSEELFFDIRTINNIRKDMACNLLAGTSEYMLQFFFLFTLSKRYQRRRLKSEVNRQWTPSDSKSSHCLWQGKLKRSQ
jgi:hypothetical protein